MEQANDITDTSAAPLKAPSSVVRTAGELDQIVRRVLRAAGADERNAARVAEALVSSNLCGVDTHGVWHLPGYVERIRGGEIDPTAWPAVLSETSNTALVSGNWTFGHVAAKYAAEIAIEKALRHDVSLVGIVQVHHVGRLGEYVELAAAQAVVAMMFAGGFSEDEPAAVPYGGRKRALHTNPIAMGFPSEEGSPVMFDFATTAISGVKVHEARDRGRTLPSGSIVDRDGNPTTDPKAFFEGGAHLPFGGHKGYAMMLAAEYLGRIFTGSDRFAERPRGGSIFGHSGATFLAFRSDLFAAQGDYYMRAREMQSRIRSIPTAPGFKEVLIPGDLEARTRAIRLRDGIPIPRDLWDKLERLETVAPEHL